jgi:hypothetical protein
MLGWKINIFELARSAKSFFIMKIVQVRIIDEEGKTGQGES